MAATSCSWTDIPCVANSTMQWLYDVLLWVPRKVWAMLLDGLASMFESIPAPDFITGAQSALNGLGSTGVVYWLTLLQVPLGMTMILSAYLLRFLVRRIPVIG